MSMSIKSIYDPNIPETIGKFTFDNKNGLGAVSDGRNVNYIGFVIYMLPKKFLSLAYPLEEKEKRKDSIELISGSSVFGCPFLAVEFIEQLKMWIVTSHEGRHRCSEIWYKQPNLPIPVHIFPSGNFDRAKYISPDMTFMPFIPEEYRSSLSFSMIPNIENMKKEIIEYKEELEQSQDEFDKEWLQKEIDKIEFNLENRTEMLETILGTKGIKIPGNRYLQGQLISSIQESKMRNTIRKILNESSKDMIRKQIENAVYQLSDEIEGRYFNEEQVEDLQKEIESFYTPDGEVRFGSSTDIRTSVFNYDNPIAETFIHGVNLRIAAGLTRDKGKTYLLYMDGTIIGEFYSVDDIKKVVKYAKENLSLDDNGNT